MSTIETNALRKARNTINYTAALKANADATKEVIGGIYELTAARQTDSTSYSRRKENSRFSKGSGRGSKTR